MARVRFGSGREDRGKVLETVDALLRLGEEFQVDAVPSPSSAESRPDLSVEVTWGSDAYQEER